MKLELHFNAFTLGILEFDGTTYTFTVNEESTKMLLKKGSQVMAFQVGQKEKKSTTLPLVFQHFLPKLEEKQELLESLGIKKSDSDFEKLCKISKLNLNKDKFWLKVEDK